MTTYIRSLDLLPSAHFREFGELCLQGPRRLFNFRRLAQQLQTERIMHPRALLLCIPIGDLDGIYQATGN